MSESRKGVDFLPEPKLADKRSQAELKNSPLPIDNEKNTAIPEQSPCTQKVSIHRKYEAIQQDVENGLSGEAIMRKYGFKRTKDLLYFLHLTSDVLEKPQLPIRFETNFEGGEKPLHPLKIAKNGSLRISDKQIKRRAKIDVPVGTEFVIKPLDDGDNEEGFKVIKLKKVD